jgi:hypothetical protein
MGVRDGLSSGSGIGGITEAVSVLNGEGAVSRDPHHEFPEFRSDFYSAARSLDFCIHPHMQAI